MPDFSAILSVPAALAVIAISKLFLDHIASEREKDRLSQAEDRKVWENHLSGTVKALVELRDEQKRQGEDAREHYRNTK